MEKIRTYVLSQTYLPPNQSNSCLSPLHPSPHSTYHIFQKTSIIDLSLWWNIDSPSGFLPHFWMWLFITSDYSVMCHLFFNLYLWELDSWWTTLFLTTTSATTKFNLQHHFYYLISISVHFSSSLVCFFFSSKTSSFY